MKTKPFYLSLFLVLASATPLFSASEVEQLRAQNAQQRKRIEELERKIAQLTPTAPPIPKVAQTSPESDATSTYTVKEGDNLLRIARSHGTTTAILSELNGLKPDAVIRIGQILKVPNASPSKPLTAIPVPTTPAPITGIQHKVAEKETLSSIAKKYEVTTSSLIKANPEINPDLVRIGQVIRIPESAKITPAAETTAVTPVPPPDSIAPTAPSQPIKITETMTFEEFARKYNTTTQRLNEINNLNLDANSVLAKGSEFYVSQP